MCTTTSLASVGPDFGGPWSAKVRCSLTSSRSFRLVNPSRKPKPSAFNVPVNSISPSLSSGWEGSAGSGWRTRSTYWDHPEYWGDGRFPAKVDRHFEYKHTLYPEIMIGTLRDPHWQGEPKPPSRSLGNHTAHIFLGNHPFMIQGCNILREFGYPEAAVMLVEDKQAIEEVRHKLPALRGLPDPHGHCLFTAVEYVSWPQTPPPGCFAKEMFDETFRHRGYATVEENEGGVTYWEAWAAADLMGSEFYERMKVAEGCEKGFVHVLDSQEAVERICTRQADYVKEVWMDRIVAHILEHGTYPPGFEVSMEDLFEGEGETPYEGLMA